MTCGQLLHEAAAGSSLHQLGSSQKRDYRRVKRDFAQLDTARAHFTPCFFARGLLRANLLEKQSTSIRPVLLN